MIQIQRRKIRMIKYKDLSAPLKFAVVLAWIAGGIFALEFIAGFILGFVGT